MIIITKWKGLAGWEGGGEEGGRRGEGGGERFNREKGLLQDSFQNRKREAVSYNPNDGK